MIEKRVPENIRSLTESGDCASFDNAERLWGGRMNETLRVRDSVIHICPLEGAIPDNAADAVSPHLHPQKGRALQALFSEILLPQEDFPVRVKAVAVRWGGSIEMDEVPRNVWEEPHVSGEHVSSKGEVLSFEDYASLLAWAASLQAQNECADTRPLKEHYEARAKAFIDFLGPSVGFSEMRSFIDLYRRMSDASVDPGEKQSFVHGDLTPSNVLVAVSDHERVLRVIDFEKALYPGDPMSDPLKLLQIKHIYMPPDAHWNLPYISELSAGARFELVRQFRSRRGLSKMTVNNVLRRDALIHLDTALSVLAARRVAQPAEEAIQQEMERYIEDFCRKAAGSVILKPS